ncbi:MAG: alpha-2-macroglobulin family protein [Odoribacter splanchnicus]
MCRYQFYYTDDNPIKFTALATTPALLFGQLSETIVTSKPLMVRPNLPRFLRTGDQTELQ